MAKLTTWWHFLGGWRFLVGGVGDASRLHETKLSTRGRRTSRDRPHHLYAANSGLHTKKRKRKLFLQYTLEVGTICRGG